MQPWSTNPTIFEINTWVWLVDLSRKYRKSVTLGTVPAEEWDTIASYGFDAVWLMGVWERSPASIAISMKNEGLLTDFRRALPDFSRDDNVGSPYSVRRYIVDWHLGGPDGLALARKMLAGRGIRLILDFVPNHVAPDHPWAMGHPEYFIHGTQEDLQQDPHSFMSISGNVYACGRDPYFPAWMDVLQLNAFNLGLRKAAIETVTSIADQCDGMRCDMAMLLMTSIFERTWGTRADPKPQTDYWPEVIAGVRRRHPDVLFMAEAYWDLEWELQQQGFDYCYDKRLYDRLEHDAAESVRMHLCADPVYQQKLVRFIENHDEPRAAATFHPAKARVAAITVSTLQGARLFHEGQFEGRKVRLPVFLGRRPEETLDRDLPEFYRKLFQILRSSDFREGEWRLCERTGWPDNASYLNLVAWCWRKDKARHLIVVNLSGARSQTQVLVPWDDLTGHSWRLTDAFTGTVYERDGSQMRGPGLYIDLGPWGSHLFECSATK